MRHPDSEYDARLWVQNTLRARARRPETRWFLAAGLVVTIALAVMEIAWPTADLPPFYLFLPLTSSLSPFAREAFLTNKGFKAFDEFEQQALLIALRRAYLIALLLLSAVVVWLALVQHAEWPMPQTKHQWFVIGCALLVTIASLPVLIAEWTVPFPVADDQID